MATLRLIVDSRPAEQGYNRARQAGARYTGSARQATQQTERLQSRFDRLRNSLFSLKGALTGIGIGLLARQLQRGVTSATALANEIDKAAATAGIGADQLQELRFAFGQLADITDQQVDAAFRRFNRRLGEARDGNERYRDSLRGLGVDINQETGPALDQVINGLGNIESSSQRSQVAAIAFGEDAGPQLASALAQGSGAINRLRQDAQDLGIVLDEDLINNAADMADEFDSLSRVLRTQFQSIILENKDTILGIVEGFNSLISAARQGDVLPSFFSRAEEGARGFTTELEKAARIILALGGGLKGASRGLVRGGLPGAALGASVSGQYGMVSMEGIG